MLLDLLMLACGDVFSYGNVRQFQSPHRKHYFIYCSVGPEYLRREKGNVSLQNNFHFDKSNLLIRQVGRHFGSLWGGHLSSFPPSLETLCSHPPAPPLAIKFDG